MEVLLVLGVLNVISEDPGVTVWGQFWISTAESCCWVDATSEEGNRQCSDSSVLYFYFCTATSCLNLNRPCDV